MPPKHGYRCAECRAPLVPVYMVYACRVRECPYGREGKGKRTWTLDHEGKGKRTLNLQGARQNHVRATISWGMGMPDEQDNRNEEMFWTRPAPSALAAPPPGLENERVWPPSALVDAWVRKGKGRGEERAIDVWIGKGDGRGKDKGNSEVLLEHVWNFLDAVEEQLSDEGWRDAWIEQREARGDVYP